MEINLTTAEVKLLLLILKEAEDRREDMCCNDPETKEQRLFTKKERIEIQKIMCPDEPIEDIDGFLFNSQYVQYIKERIEQQVKE